jgi:hypothetical protein
MRDRVLPFGPQRGGHPEPLVRTRIRREATVATSWLGVAATVWLNRTPYLLVVEASLLRA